MSFPVTVQTITASQTLETGFRQTANANFLKQIVNVTISPDLKQTFTFADGTTGVVDLGQFIFSKSQANGQAVPIASEMLAGKIKIANATDTLEGLNDTSAVTPYKLDQYFQYILSRDFVTSEALSAGDMVNVFDDNGTQKIRKAVSTDTAKFCCGYVREAAAVGDEVTMFVWGIVTGYSGLTPGMPYYLSSTTPGGIQKANPNSNFSQLVGFAIANDTLYFNAAPARPIQEDPIEWIDIEGQRTNEGFIPQTTYVIGNLVNGRQIIKVSTWQTDYGDRLLQPKKPNKQGGQWQYNPESGELEIDADWLPDSDGAQIIVEMRTFGTAGFGYGTDIKLDGTNILYKFNNEDDYKNAGAIPLIGGGTVGVYNVTTPVSDGQIYTHTYNTKDIDIKVKDTQGRTDTVIYATPIDNNSFRLNIPENETFTGKLLLSVYPETLS